MRVFPGRRRRPRVRGQRGQSLLEFSLTLPLLVLLLGMVLEGGLAFNAWLLVNNASRDATRFRLDGGRTGDVVDLAISKLPGLEPTNLDVYIIEGMTDGTGAISTSDWNITHAYGSGAGPELQRAEIETRLGGVGAPEAANVPFTIVEIDYQYELLFLPGIIGYSAIPMTSYTIVQQY